MNMRDYLSEKLRDLSSTEDCTYLREVMEEVFLQMYDESEQKYKALETRVIDSFPFHAKQFVIKGTVMQKNHIGRDCPWLLPMLPADLSEDKLTEEMPPDNILILDTVLLLADYQMCHELASSQRKFRGTVKTKDSSYSVIVRLRPTTKYAKIVENLYNAFMDNGIQWVTPNLPYLNKFFDVVCIDPKEFGIQSPILEWSVDFGAYEAKLVKDIIPVWNIKQIEIGGQVVPRPVLDELAYEYYIELDDNSIQNGFLVDYSAGSIVDIRREGQGVMITSTTKQGMNWKLYQFYQQEPSETMQFEYFLHSNRQEESFCGRLSSYYQSKIKTKAELFRLVHSYETAQEIRMESFYLTSAHMTGDGYELNHYITDEIRDNNSSKRLVLQFKPTKSNHLLNCDLLSFLTAQVQLIYPEYYCVGVII